MSFSTLYPQSLALRPIAQLDQPSTRRLHGDGEQPQRGGGPLADSQRPAGGSAQDVEGGRTHAVDSEAWDGHRGQSLPHKGVHHGHGHPAAAAYLRARYLVSTRDT